jgi:spermidine synthase
MIPLRQLLSAFLAGVLCSTLSLADERVIHTRTSAFNTIVVTEDGEGLRAMRFNEGSARQSVMRPGDPEHLEAMYARAMPVILAFVPQPRRMLVIGLGGGTVPTFLHRKLPELQIDVVELDPAVIEVAKSHFGFAEDRRLQAHAGDGRRFIEQRQEGDALYDLVLLDAFDAEEVPYALATREFLGAVRRVMSPRSAVVGNLWGPSQNRLYASMVRTYQDVYRSVSVIELPEAVNRLVIASAGAAPPDADELLANARRISTRLSLRDDLARIVGGRYRSAMADGAAGQVLRDADAQLHRRPAR